VARGAVVLRLAAAAFGNLTGGYASFAGEASLFPALGVERVEIVTAVAHDPALTFTLVLALAPTAAGTSVTTSAIEPRFLRLFSRWNGEGGERKLEDELAQAVVGDSGDQHADGNGSSRTHRDLRAKRYASTIGFLGIVSLALLGVASSGASFLLLMLCDSKSAVMRDDGGRRG
jgi:hypothetical protein